MVKKAKCIQCKKTLLRKSKRILEAKEKYKGNMICYREKFNEVTKSWSYMLWDGESYKLLFGKNFCGRACAADWALARN